MVWEDGAIKIGIVNILLRLRQRSPRLFRSGTYSSLYASGAKRDCCVAFHRRSAIQDILMIVPRFTTRLGSSHGPFDWGDTQLLIDESPTTLRDLPSSRTLTKRQDSVPPTTLQNSPFSVFTPL